jgi:hypothetical protein
MVSDQDKEYSQTWMQKWLQAAAGVQSVPAACEAAGISMSKYIQGRLDDLDFDRAALVFDQVIDLMILTSVRHHSIDGDPRAQALYYSKARLPAFVPAFPSWQSPAPADPAGAAPTIDPIIAEAMINAGLELAERGGRGPAEAPQPGAATARRRRARKPRNDPPAPR